MALASKSDIVLLFIKKATDNEKVEIPGVMGKKALQKSMYFFNERINSFYFKWRDYGPFSGELQQIAQDLILNGNAVVKEIPTGKEGATIQNLTFSSEHNLYFSEIKFPDDVDKKLNEIIKFTSGKKPRELELLASVHFWAKKQQFMLDEYTSKYIHNKLTELKPDAGFNESNVKGAIETLEFNEYLKPTKKEN